MVLRVSNYKDFRRSLKVDFLDAKGELIFEKQEELKILMSRKGYRIRTDKETKVKFNDNPTDLQLNFAWNYLTGLPEAQREIDDYFITAIINDIRHDRLKKGTRIIDGKLYRGGQFIPRRK